MSSVVQSIVGVGLAHKRTLVANGQGARQVKIWIVTYFYFAEVKHDILSGICTIMINKYF